MKVSTFCTGSVIFLSLGHPSFAQPSGSSSVRIVVEEQGWGNGRPQDIQKVLESAAAELLRYFPERRIPLIRVAHAVDCPRILYERGKDGEYIIQLSANDQYWAQYAYQFAHELCHLLSNYDRSFENRKGPENGWFDESLCELASMFVVRKMAETWETNPPYDNWRSFAPELRRYADDLLANTEKIPANMSLAQWLARNLDSLRKDPVLRAKNAVVAAALLPLFQQRPESWEAVSWLNLAKGDDANSFERYVADWHYSCPKKCRPAVQEIAKRLSVDLTKNATPRNAPFPPDRQ